MMEQEGLSPCVHGDGMWEDETTGQVYAPSRAMHIAKARRRMRLHNNAKDQDSLVVGVRTGCLANEVALRELTAADWLCSYNDPKGSQWPIQVYKMTKAQFDKFKAKYMAEAGRQDGQ